MDPLLFLSKLQNNYFRADLPSFIIINYNLLKYINNKNMKYFINIKNKLLIYYKLLRDYWIYYAIKFETEKYFKSNSFYLFILY